METYWRLLRFASPIGRYALPYLLLTLFAVVFTTLNLALLAPLLSTLFAETSPEEHLSRPEHWYALMDQFAYYSARLKAEHGAYAALQFICIGLVLSVLLSNLFRYGSERIMENLRIHMLVRMRKAIYTHVLALPLPYLNTQRKGDILARLASDVQVVQYAVTGTLQVLFKEPFQLLAYLVVLFALSYKLTLFSLLVLPVAAFVIAQIVKKLKAQATAAQESYSRMISLIDETLSAIKIIRGHQAAERMEAAFERENQHFARLGRKMAKRQQLSSPVSEFLGVCMVALLVLYGGNLVIQENSELSAAEFITYIAVFSQLMRPAKAISSSFSTIHSGLAAGERVLQLLDTPTVTAEEEEVPFRLQRFEREIHFDQVYFAYGKPVLKGIQLRIRKGQTVALVGPSGGGKSTLMDLSTLYLSQIG
ncbi:ABC transporter ATP-binding protein [Nitritalea halalkaliphila]|uniref:ABC transporter ATP-binding protein n=1 Tax=Nitritalea halalkaliphila TaxID=590849 RepID=UPI00030961AB|nr:ABC transporter ATP-binding protein [Nitritalea halalkaliphila]